LPLWLLFFFIEEIAWRLNWIGNAQLKRLAAKVAGNSYGRYLLELLQMDRRAYLLTADNESAPETPDR